MQTLGAVVVSEHADLLESLLIWIRATKLFDQIVVIADTKGGPGTEYVARILADTVEVMDVPHQGAVLDHAFSLCTTDWVFRIDDDERMGVNFVSGVKDLVETSKYDVYKFPRYWLWPDENHYIGNGCWSNDQDRQIRLWKNGSVYSSGGIHVDLLTTPSARTAFDMIDWRIFHYILVHNSYSERLEKVSRYAALHNESLEKHRSWVGQFYLPEDATNLLILTCKEKLWTQ